MNLLQKLPAGLGLACLMIISGCSRENLKTPEPEIEQVNLHSNLETGGGLIVAPTFPKTDGQTGFHVYPWKWVRRANSMPDNLLEFPSGSSSLGQLWGNAALPWAKALPAIPSVQNITAFPTVVTRSNQYGYNSRSAVGTTIKNLKKGKTYSIKFFVASTIQNGASDEYGNVLAYAKTAVVLMAYNIPSQQGDWSTYVDLSGKQAEWVSKEITFLAPATEVTFKFSAITAQPGQYAYAHIFVDKNAIKEVK